MAFCKTCKFWEPLNRFSGEHSKNGECDGLDGSRMDTRGRPKEQTFTIEVSVHDDSGLNVRLITGPNFGCVLHEEK